MTVTLFDAITLDKATRRKTADGYVVAMTPVARTGIQDYLGRELDPSGENLLPNQVYKAYRPKDAVMADSFIQSFPWKPITDNHPDTAVTADNWRDLAVGIVGEVVPDGERVMAAMMLTDSATQRAVDSGKSQVSVGYESEIVFKAGVTDSGEAYDVVQVPKRVNHIAVVDRGRAGPDFKIPSVFDTALRDAVKIVYDSLSKDSPLKITAIMVGDATYQVADEDAAKLMKLIADKDEMIGQLKAECADNKAKILSDSDVAKMVAELSALGMVAKKIIGDSYDAVGKSVIEIKRDVVAKRFGDEAVKTAASDAEIEGIYKVASVLPVEKTDDSVRNEIKTGATSIADADAAIKDAINKRFNQEAK